MHYKKSHFLLLRYSHFKYLQTHAIKDYNLNYTPARPLLTNCTTKHYQSNWPKFWRTEVKEVMHAFYLHIKNPIRQVRKREGNWAELLLQRFLGLSQGTEKKLTNSWPECPQGHISASSPLSFPKWRCYGDIGIPIPQTLVVWASPSHVTLTIWGYRGCPYH